MPGPQIFFFAQVHLGLWSTKSAKLWWAELVLLAILWLLTPGLERTTSNWSVLSAEFCCETASKLTTCFVFCSALCSHIFSGFKTPTMTPHVDCAHYPWSTKSKEIVSDLFATVMFCWFPKCWHLGKTFLYLSMKGSFFDKGNLVFVWTTRQTDSRVTRAKFSTGGGIALQLAGPLPLHPDKSRLGWRCVLMLQMCFTGGV